jgi:hypothetical protein
VENYPAFFAGIEGSAAGERRHARIEAPYWRAGNQLFGEGAGSVQNNHRASKERYSRTFDASHRPVATSTGQAMAN